MRRLMALTCVSLLALSAPAFAQGGQTGSPSYGAGNGSQNYGAGGQGSGAGDPADQQAQGSGVEGTGGAQGTAGTDAYAQAPGFGNVSPFLIIGGIAGGAGLIAYAVSQNQNDNPTSP